MPKGSCLCGAVRWACDAELSRPHSCHCTICQKVHGTAYGLYASIPAGALRWLAGHERVQTYRSSENGRRCFCEQCGSTVPQVWADGSAGIALGSLDDEPGLTPKLLEHIFVESLAPWHQISDGLPQYETWPPGLDYPVLPTPDRESRSADRVGGSCLCGQVTYAVTAPFREMRHCHCSRCRRARAAPHASNAICSPASFRWLRGEDLLRRWKVPEAQFFTQTFCSACGSPMPTASRDRDFVVVPGGSLDDDPGVRPNQHIFVGSKLSWFPITDGLPQRAERT